jgi:alpha-tubulin suppressor-like RCC1 family protein
MRDVIRIHSARLVLRFAALVTLAACQDQTEPFAPRVRGGGTKAALSVSTSSSATAVLSVEVRGGDFREPLLYNLPLTDGQSAAALTIPEGGPYELHIRAHDGYGETTHEGYASVERAVVGEVSAVKLALDPIGEGEGIKVGLDVVGERRMSGLIISGKADRDRLLQGESMTLRLAIQDREGRPIEVNPAEVHWAISDLRGGRLVPEERAASAKYYSSRYGDYQIIAIFHGNIFRWKTFTLFDPYVQVSAGFDFTCGRRQSGNVFCWGFNWHNELATPLAPDACQGTTCSSHALQVAVNHTFKSVATGWDHACAIETTGGTLCWGDNYYGQLGLNTKGTIESTPKAVQSGTTQFESITAGHSHTCGIASGAAYCWGDNWWGELGIGNAGINSTGPNEKMVPTQVTGGFTWRALTAGQNFTCGLHGTVTTCWGMPNEGELGNGLVGGLNSPSSSSNNVALSFSPSLLSTTSLGTTMCAISGYAAAWCWGSNQGMTLGNATVTGMSSNVPVTVDGANQFLGIANGTYHTCAVDGADVVFCWGYNLEGRVGVDPASSTQVNAPQAIPNVGALFTSVSVGNRHSCALATSGDIYCWGDNGRAQLGRGTVGGSSFTPARVM